LRLSVKGENRALAEAVRACRRHLVAAALFSALINLLYLAPTLYMLQVYDRVVPTRGHLTLALLTLALVFALGCLALIDVLRSRLLVRASLRLERRLAGEILSAAMSRPGAAAEALAKQALREFDTMRQTLTGAGVLALFDAPWTPIYILVCFFLHPFLGLLTFAGAGLLLFLAFLSERTTNSRLQRANAAAGAAYVSQEFASAGAEVVRALGMRNAMVRRQLAEREKTQQLSAEASFAGGGYVATSRFARLFLQSLALGVGAWLAIDQKISAGAIFAASLLLARALSPMEQVVGAWRGLAQARSAWRTLRELLDAGAESLPATRLPAPTGALEVERLTVLTPSRDSAILHGVHFQATAGEVIGVVGPSGAGKSTLLRAIAGAVPADQGAIRFDGAEIADYEAERLAACLGYMPQEASLFAGTVKENIARFRNHLDDDLRVIDDAVIAAAKTARAHEMILRLPYGYDTPLGLGGRGLSAGQAQRIALARALFGEPTLLLLDEPNAHLDGDGEGALGVTLSGLKGRGVTVIIVAHRTGVLMAADKLMVLRDGRMEQFGQRDEVMARLTGGPVRSIAPVPAALNVVS
jgi:ATP-binding cassette subfamily C protein